MQSLTVGCIFVALVAYMYFNSGGSGGAGDGVKVLSTKRHMIAWSESALHVCEGKVGLIHKRASEVSHNGCRFLTSFLTFAAMNT